MNRWVTYIALLLLICTSLYLLDDMGFVKSQWSSHVVEGKIGTLASISKSVSYRHSNKLYWSDAKQDQILKYYDSILTLENSKAQIKLVDGSIIEIEPNTLIVFEPIYGANGQLKLVIQKGNLRTIHKSFGTVITVDDPATNNEMALEPLDFTPTIPKPERVIAAVETKEEPPPEAVEDLTIDIVKLKPTKPRVRNWSVWFGSGANYLKYDQTIANFTEASYQSLTGPSFFGRFVGYLNKKFGLDFSAKASPGSVNSSATIPVSNGKYYWYTLSSELLYKLSNPDTHFFGKDLTYDVRLGFQGHSMPFLAALDSGGAEIRKNSMVMASAGVDFTFNKKGRWLYELMARYQYPLHTSADGSNQFKISPISAFDGSMGVAYRLSEPLLLGLYWYGQWHQYNFNYFESIEGVTNTGYQSLFYSNAELRLGWEF